MTTPYTTTETFALLTSLFLALLVPLVLALPTIRKHMPHVSRPKWSRRPRYMPRHRAVVSWRLSMRVVAL